MRYINLRLTYLLTYPSVRLFVCRQKLNNLELRSLHCVPKKLYTKLMAITLSIPNGFSNSFTARQRSKFPTKSI